MFGQDIERMKLRARQALLEHALRPRPPLKTRLCNILKGMLLIALITALTVLILFVARIRIAGAEAMHGDRPARGWFWYEAPRKSEQKKPATQKERQKPKEPEKSIKKDFEFPVLDTAPEALKKFLKEPTEESAKEYLAWQYKYFEHLKKIGYTLRDVYLRFGGNVYPVNGYPESPLASIYYHNALDDIYRKAIDSVRGRIGLIYFYKASCPECLYQKEIIRDLVRKYDLPVRGVSVDGQVDDTLPFPSAYNPALIERFGITQAPSLIAVLDKDGAPAVAGLSAGLTSLSMIEQQLVRFLVNAGEIKERDLNPVFISR